MSQHSKAMQLKQFLKEYLWFLLLLAPLAVMPFLIFEKPASEKRRVVKTESQQTVLSQSIEVTSAQVATIVAKPITELLQMEVYVKSQRIAVNMPESVVEERYAHLPKLLMSKMTYDAEIIIGALAQPSQMSNQVKGNS